MERRTKHQMVFARNRLLEVSKAKVNFNVASWRNGSASDSRSEGCVFNSRPGHCCVVSYNEEWCIKWPIIISYFNITWFIEETSNTHR